MSTKASAGFPLFPILFCILLTLKLTIRPELSWWWVWAPFTIPLCVAAILLGAAGLIAVFSKR